MLKKDIKKRHYEVESDLKKRKYEIKIVGNFSFKNFEISSYKYFVNYCIVRKGTHFCLTLVSRKTSLSFSVI